MKEFPKAKALSLQELEQRRSPTTEGVVVRRAQVRGQEAATNPCTSSRSEPSASELLRTRDEALASTRVPKTLNRLHPGWSVERLRGLENMVLPQFDYAFDNPERLISMVAHQLQQCGPLIGRGRLSEPPQQCSLALAIFCDGITPRGRPNVNIKATLVDMGGALFLFVGNISQTAGFLSWREMSKVGYCTWVAENRPKKLNAVAAQCFVVPVRFCWGVHRVQVTVTARRPPSTVVGARWANLCGMPLGQRRRGAAHVLAGAGADS